MPVAVEQLAQDARSYTLPAPVGGWNTRDPLNDMSELYATAIDNWFPNERDIAVRSGFEVFTSSAIGAAFQTLAEYCAEDGTKKFVGAGNGNLYNVTTGLPSTIGLSFASNQWQTLQMNHTLLLFNGEDQPQQYTGTTTSSAAYTGIADDNKLVQATSYRNRIYAVEKDSASLWYGANSASITGALNEFNLAYALRRGGALKFVTNWTRNSGEYLSELLVIVSSEGEVLAYAGASPDDASFTLVAHLLLDKPLSRRAYLQRGPELEILTETGPVPLSEALALQNTRLFENTLSAAIAPTFNAATARYSANFGWEMVAYPKGKYVLYNIPVASGENAEQFIRNIYTGAWCRFTGQRSSCWAVYDGDLYFAGFNGHIYKADTGVNDNGALIQTDLRLAYSYLGDKQRLKEMALARPILTSDGSASFGVGADMDFETRAVVDTVETMGSSGARWGDPWGSAWASGAAQAADWISITGIGRAMSLHLKGALANVTARLNAVNVIFKPGGYF